MSRALLIAVTLLCVALSPTPGYAQSNAETNAGVQFDFSLPGARSLGLGGAFVALADDATAGWANPAGLTILARREVSIEVRGWRFSNFITDRGMAFGSSSGVGFDSVDGLTDAEQSDMTGSIAFLSAVFPGDRWTFAAYRHQLANFEAHVQSSGPFLRTNDFRVDPLGEIDRVDPFIGEMRLKIASYGGAFGYRPNDQLSVGANIGFHDFEQRGRTRRYQYIPPHPPAIGDRPAFVQPGERFGPPDFSEANLNIDEMEEGDDFAVGVGLGVLFRDRGGRWSVGAAYRMGPSFNVEATAIAGPGAALLDVYTPGEIVDREDIRFKVPDVIAIGVSGRPTPDLLVSVEYDRVLYSQLSDENAEVYGVEEAPFELNATIGRLIRETLRFPDANQLRAGVEYTVVRPSSTILLRFGGWFDPDHRLAFDDSGLEPGEEDLVKRLPVLFRPGSDELHIAPGIGFVFSRFQIDAAVDLSDRINSFSVSTVWRY